MVFLVVDDSRTMRMILQRTLNQAGFGEHAVAQARDGFEGLEQVAKLQPDVIFCDWNMPNMNGLAFLQALNEQGYTGVFGFVTSVVTAEMMVLANKVGADFVMTKPFTAASLGETLRRVGIESVPPIET